MKTKSNLEQAVWLLGLLVLRSVNADFKCPSAGRYLDPLSDCQKYFACYESDGRLLYKSFNCPKEQLYSVEEARCITASNLVCKELTGATPTPPNTEIEVEPIHDFVCRSEGIFVNEFDPDCKSFITCTRISGRSYNLKLHHCPTETIFCHNTFECVPNVQYDCPRKSSENAISSTHSLTTTTTQRQETSETELPTTQSSTTIYATADTTNVIKDETTPYAVTSDEVSSESLETTVDTITSSDSEKSEIMIPETTPSTVTSDEEIIASSNSLTIENKLPGTTPSENPETPSTVTGEESPPLGYNFTCATIGRFPNLADSKCGSYILCSKYNGTFLPQMMSCGRSFFNPDPDVRRCDLEYSCSQSTTATPIQQIEQSETQPSTTEEVETSPTSIKEPKPSASITTSNEISTETQTTESSTDVTEPVSDNTNETESRPLSTESERTDSSTDVTKPAVGYNTTENPISTVEDRNDPSAAIVSITEDVEPTFSDTTKNPNTDESSTSELTSTTLIDVSTYPPECMADPIRQFTCPDSGRYKDIESTDCRTYILCLRTVIGELVYAKLNCEDGTLYSHETGNCVSSEKYSCFVQ